MPKSKASKTKGKSKVKVGIKDPQVIPKVNHEPPGKPPKKIKILECLSGTGFVFEAGQVKRVPQEVEVKTARSWIKSGVAEEVEE